VTTLDCFFDCSSPWTYLAFEAIQPVAARHGVPVRWRPILVGGVFNAVNPSVYEQRERPVPAKARYHAKDLADWARLAGLRIGSPPVFPVNSVKVMRGALWALDHDCLVPYARAFFEAYWGELRDISDDAVIRDVLRALDLPADAILAAAADPACKDRLRANTDELVERGGFGSPTFFVNGDDLYFGNDRVPLVDAALARAGETAR
jgi:2-hydroxychromene-2-carboxylate isomerase